MATQKRRKIVSKGRQERVNSSKIDIRLDDGSTFGRVVVGDRGDDIKNVTTMRIRD